MKRQKTNWQKKGIIDIQNRYQLSEQQAKEYWRKAYRVTRLNVKYGNKAYQTYAGFFNNVSYIDFTINKEFDESGAVTGSKLNTKINTELINNNKKVIIDKLKSLADKYPKITESINSYIADEITYNELKKRINYFKRTDIEYIKSGSG